MDKYGEYRTAEWPVCDKCQGTGNTGDKQLCGACDGGGRVPPEGWTQEAGDQARTDATRAALEDGVKTAQGQLDEFAGASSGKSAKSKK